METAGLSGIDWSVPWLRTYADIGREIASAADWRTSLNQHARQRGITNEHGDALAFDAPDAAGGRPYEAFVAETGRVPTRANRHDFFNALAWLLWPRTKARLNTLQARAIAASGIGATRGALRDAATLVDENAALLVTLRTDLVDALREHDWQRCFVTGRAAWFDDVRAVAFGHALIEKLERPYKAITAHSLHVALPSCAADAEIDAAAAEALDTGLIPRRLLPLPVLGIPGWSAENEDAGFYSDARVFRPRGADAAISRC